MSDSESLIVAAYAAFNRRDIDAALALMSDGIRWPRASEGGVAVGKDAIRAYWSRQWQQFDPHVEPIAITMHGNGEVEVRVHQLVKSLAGEVLSDSVVHHIYTVSAGLLSSMHLGGESADGAPSAPFASL